MLLQIFFSYINQIKIYFFILILAYENLFFEIVAKNIQNNP